VSTTGKRTNDTSAVSLVNMDEQAIRKAYARWAPIYDKTFGIITDAGRQYAIRRLNKRPPSRILEVGVGTGISLPLWSDKHRITGIDIPGLAARISGIHHHGLR